VICRTFSLSRLALLSLLACAFIWAQESVPSVTTTVPSRPLPARVHAPINLSAVPMTVLDPLPDTEVTRRGAHGLPRLGTNRPLARGAVRGVWLPDGSGDWGWSAAIRSRGARGLRVHFENFDAGAGEVWIHDGDPQGRSYGPYIGRGMFGDGDFWTEIIPNETLYMEYRAPSGSSAANLEFTVPEIFHFWQDPLQPLAVNQTCFLDATCYLLSGADPLYKSVAYLLIGDHTCSGALINDRSLSLTPYLLTAGHCVADQNEARSMIAYFNYRTATCGGPSPVFSAGPAVAGAELLSRNVSLIDGFSRYLSTGLCISAPPVAAHPGMCGSWGGTWRRRRARRTFRSAIRGIFRSVSHTAGLWGNWSIS
jgi:hypothetical protein